MQKHETPLRIGYDVRNKIIQENSKKHDLDIIQLPRETHYPILTSYITEKQMFEGINERLGKVFYSKDTANFRVTNSVDAFKKNQVTTRFGLIRQINDAIKKDYQSSKLNCGFDYSDLAFLGSKNAGVAPFGDKSDLKAYWKFIEASSPIVNVSQDAADLGTAADLTATGVIFGQTGIITGLDCVSHDATDDILVAGTSKSQFNYMCNAGGKFSIALWVKQNATEQSTVSIYSTKTQAGNNGTMIRNINPATANKRSFDVFLVHSGSQDTFQFTDIVDDDTNWQLWIFTWDEDGGTNNFQASINGAAPSQATAATTTVTANATQAFKLCSRDNVEEWNTLIDEVPNFNRVLSNAEFAEWYNSGVGRQMY